MFFVIWRDFRVQGSKLTNIMYDNDRLLKNLERPEQPTHENKNNQLTPKNGKSWGHRLLKAGASGMIFIIVLFITFYVHGRANNQATDSLAWINRIPIIGQIKSMAEGAFTPLRGEERGRINIILMGVGGKGHDGAELTDTLMVVSLDIATKKVSLLSIPRDLSAPIESIGWRKINAVNSYAEKSQTGSGGLATSQAISNILGQPIDYYIKVDFDGFVGLVDQLGGLDICVDRAFDDYTYPADGQEANPVYVDRFEHLHFEAGCQKMDGTLALKYARSRHAYGPEGTDFARAARQQKVIQAAKEKLLNKSLLFNPKILSDIATKASANISTNIKAPEIMQLWSLVKDIPKEKVNNKVLSNSPEGFLVDATGTDGAYLLLPRTGNFNEIQYLFKNIFVETPQATKTKIKAENAKIQIMNGTWINGLASKTSVDLEKMGFTITGLANASRQDFETSVIYDLTFGQKTEALKTIKESLGANVSFNLPDWLKVDLATAIENSVNKEQPDLVLILGQDAKQQ